jgi:cytosine/adenosine deaminase-related metal-dependent hydrolase
MPVDLVSRQARRTEVKERLVDIAQHIVADAPAEELDGRLVISGFIESHIHLPKKSTCLSIYSFTVNSGKSLEQVLAENFPWCAEWEKELRRLFRSYTAAKQ